MVSTPVPVREPECEVVYYDPEFRRLYRLETRVPEVGEVIEGMVVERVFSRGQRFRGLKMVYVYLRNVS